MLGDVIYHDFSKYEKVDSSIVLPEAEIIDLADFRKRHVVVLASRLEKELDNFFSNNRKELSNLCEDVFRLNPRSPVALSCIAVKKYLAKTWSEAMHYLYEALDIEPENKYAMVAMMSFFGSPPSDGYFSSDEIFDFAMKAGNAHPGDPEVLVNLLSLSIYSFCNLEMDERVRMAEDYYERGMALDPVRFKLYECPVNKLKDRMNA